MEPSKLNIYRNDPNRIFLPRSREWYQPLIPKKYLGVNKASKRNTND